ncbi:MAG TPA: alpha/beta hydrolase [Pyrinomonadaceae bacterium]|nr:alpha/beta hydrolase [Pyrinomonadaceae bacterium]
MKRLVAGGRGLEYVWHGPSPGDAPTLVFLHEGLGCVSTWRDFPSRVAEATGCGALVYSRAGYGKSDPVTLPRPVSFMHDEALVTLPEVLDAAGVREAILVGHSDGASIALVYAGAARDGRLRGLVLEAPHVFVEDLSVASIRRAAAQYREGGLKRALKRHHGANTECAFWGWNRVWLDPAFRSWNIEEYLPRITVPVLVIQGAEDEYGTPRQVEAIERGCAGPVRSVLLRECGHGPHRDQPGRALDEITSFIGALMRDRVRRITSK